jgi:L-asparaginase / beta-aspartyl-peptidase
MPLRTIRPAASAILALPLLAACATSAPVPATAGMISPAPAVGLGAPVIVVHGGAGTILRDRIQPETEARIRAALDEALRAGHAILAAGGSALDAVEAAVRVLEDAPDFNAGRGAVFNTLGVNELDAAIMDGRTLMAGAVTGVQRVRNPITLARRVMDSSAHVFMAGEGAEAFGRERGIEFVDPSYFHTPARWDALERARAEERRRSGGQAADRVVGTGTAGAVALDRHGDLAAATSTGGTTNKRHGRIGDAPVIGAGTYANNRACAVSATGAGEYFIRNVVAYDICARSMYSGIPLRDAADAVVMQTLVAQGGTGGVIALDPAGVVSMPFNTPGMYRGYMGPDGRPVVELYRD